MTLSSDYSPDLESERVQNAVQTTSSLEVALAVWRRRKWRAALILAFVLSAIIPIVKGLPNIYESTATVLVQYHQTPESLAGPLAADDLETRLHTISQQIMSRARLYDLVSRFNLYPDLRQRATPEATVERMRRDIKVQFSGVRQPSGLDVTVAFSLSYRGRDPQTVAQVTNALAALYVEENTKIREQQTTETTAFLQAQLADAKRRLDDQERKIIDYQERHMGELPEQQAANVAALERLNLRAREIVDRRDALAKGLPVAAVDTTSARLARLRQELADLRMRDTDEHPDVIRVKQEIANLQRQPAIHAGPRAAAQGSAHDPDTPPTAVEVELAGLRNEEQAVRREIVAYEQRIETAPLRELELHQLSRDEGSAKDLYQSLLQRYENAQLAERMQQRQGEQFRILDPAVASQKPVGPQRLRILVIALVGGVGAAVSMALLAEAGDTSFRTVDEVRSFTSIPVFASIPTIVTEKDARRRRRQSGLAVLAAALSIVTVFGLSSYLAHSTAVFGIFTSGRP